MPKEKVWKTFRLGKIIHEMGRSRVPAICECGTTNVIYIWSWAGIGSAKCSGCQGWLQYPNHWRQ